MDSTISHVPAIPTAEQPAPRPPAAHPVPMCGIQDLPVEIFLHIASLLASSADALNLARTCRSFHYGSLSPENQTFWYRIAPFTEPFYIWGNYKSYLQLSMRSPLQSKCQLCCVRRSFKFWDQFQKRICPECFVEHTVERPRIAFLKLDLSGLVSQKRRGPSGTREHLWKHEVELVVAKKYPGRFLKSMLERKQLILQDRATVRSAYRTRQRNLVEESARRQLENHPTFAVHRNIVASVDVQARIRQVIQDEITKRAIEHTRRLCVMVNDKPQAWVDECGTKVLSEVFEFITIWLG